MLKRKWPIIVATVFIAGSTALFFLYEGGLLIWNPAFRDSNIIGLTPAQITAKFGPPVEDSRDPSQNPTTDPSEYWMVYFRTFQNFLITFKDGKAIRVD